MSATSLASNVPAEFVVGIGASAGGLEALETLLDHTEPNDRCALVVVTHLSPDFISVLDELLKRRTKMVVKVAEDGDVLHSQVVYVIPPNKEMITAQGRLLLKDRDRNVAQHLPIDVFFRSLAREYERNAVAVVLSGTGSDGSRGLEDVRAHQGFVIVQNPDEAKFDGMPNAAISTGVVNLILDAQDIGSVIASNINGKIELPVEKQMTDEKLRSTDIDRILKMVTGSSQIDFSGYKINTIHRRIRRRMASRGHDTMRGYADDLISNAEELEILTADLLIGVTEFFRDPEAFDELRRTVIPALVERSSNARPIRIWSAACSTGEEAYSIAIQLYLEGRTQGKPIEPQIFATDLKSTSIDVAGRGIYTAAQLENIPEQALELCFEQIDPDHYQIINRIRRWIVFASHNILSDPPFTRMDLISCRNALIYLENDAQQKALSLFNFGLREGGFLFLGPSESLAEQEQDFEAINSRWRVYTKIGASAAVRLATTAKRNALEPTNAETRSFSTPPQRMPLPQLPRLPTGYATLIENLVPSGVLISAQYEVLHVFGDARLWLRAPVGAMSNDITLMVAPELRVVISTAVDKSRSEKKTIVFPHVKTFEGGKDAKTSVHVKPLFSTVTDEATFFLISFDCENPENVTTPTVIVDAESISSERIDRLEHQLAQSRESLQATIEEVETSNEELQSTNEEMMAANEELQSTNEELQSVNEELYTVNAEYQKKNDELIDLSRDVENLMSATEIGVVFVDDRLIVKRFTSAATEVLNFMPQDVGRSLEHITHSLIKTDLPNLVRQALRSRRPTSLERMSESGQWWQIRIHTMRAAKGTTDGVVITLYDITTVKTAELELREKSSELNSIAIHTGARSMRHRQDGGLLAGQSGWTALTGQPEAEAEGFGWYKRIVKDDRNRIEALWTHGIEQQSTSLEAFFRVNNDDGTPHHIRLVSTREEDANNDGWTSVIFDVEDAVQSDQVVRSSEQMLMSLIRTSTTQMVLLNPDLTISFVNEAFSDQMDEKVDNLLNRKLEDVLENSMFNALKMPIAAAFEGERLSFNEKPEKGQKTINRFSISPQFSTNGTIEKVAVNIKDVSEVVKAVEKKTTTAQLIGSTFIASNLAFMTITDKKHRIGFASAEASRIVGYSAAELSRHSLSDLLPEYDPERFSDLIEKARNSGSNGINIETILLRRSGQTVDVELKLMVDSDSDSQRILVMINSLSEARSAEATLRRRTAELTRSNRMLELFAVAATHELKSPLRKISKFAELLVEDYGKDLGDGGAETIGVIYQSAERMRHVVDSVLKLTSIERATPDIEELGLDQVFERITVDLSAQITESNAKIYIDPLPAIFGDRTMIEILFGNLVKNALDHREEGKPIKIEVKANVENDVAYVTVSDNGPGIGAESEDDAFMPFTQFGNNRNGTGMGLAICQRVALAHNGMIEIVKSTKNGTQIAVTLPLVEQAEKLH